MWKGFILTVVEVRAVACSESSSLFPPCIPRTSPSHTAARGPGGAHGHQTCERCLEFLSTFLIPLVVTGAPRGPAQAPASTPGLRSSICAVLPISEVSSRPLQGLLAPVLGGCGSPRPGFPSWLGPRPDLREPIGDTGTSRWSPDGRASSGAPSSLSCVSRPT